MDWCVENSQITLTQALIFLTASHPEWLPTLEPWFLFNIYTNDLLDVQLLLARPRLFFASFLLLQIVYWYGQNVRHLIHKYYRKYQQNE